MKKSNQPPLLAVRAFIQDADGKILILKRATNDAYGAMWCLPGGKVDYGQTAEEAIVREMNEETSLVCTSIRFLFYMDGMPVEQDDNHYLTLFFNCHSMGEISLNFESSDFAWIGPGELTHYKFAFGTDKAIEVFWKQK